MSSTSYALVCHVTCFILEITLQPDYLPCGILLVLDLPLHVLSHQYCKSDSALLVLDFSLALKNLLSASGPCSLPVLNPLICFWIRTF